MGTHRKARMVGVAGSLQRKLGQALGRGKSPELAQGVSKFLFLYHCPPASEALVNKCPTGVGPATRNRDSGIIRGQGATPTFQMWRGPPNPPPELCV